MKIIAIIVLLLTSAFNLAAQSLPADLQAAVTISESGSSRDLLNTMMNYEDIQQVRLGILYNRRDHVAETIEQMKRAARSRKVVGWTSLVTGVLAGGAYVYFAGLGNDAYDNYLNATITADAVDYKEQFRLYDLLGYVSLGVAGAGALVSADSFLMIPSLDILNNEYSRVDKEIQYLEGALQ